MQRKHKFLSLSQFVHENQEADMNIAALKRRGAKKNHEEPTPKTPREVQRRLMHEANGSFRIVHKALTEVGIEKKSRHLNLDDVVDRIHKLLKSEKIRA